jgi:galactokinase
MQIFVPGRVCLFGEHSDWAGAYRTQNPAIHQGLALVLGTQQGIHARVYPNKQLVLKSSLNNDQVVEFACDMEFNELNRRAREGGFFSYACGVAAELIHRFPIIKSGVYVENYKTDLPIAKGLSSSAAICVLVARAFGLVYDLKLSVQDEMDIAYQGEVII